MNNLIDQVNKMMEENERQAQKIQQLQKKLEKRDVEIEEYQTELQKAISNNKQWKLNNEKLMKLLKGSDYQEVMKQKKLANCNNKLNTCQ